ncbi:MAG: cellulase family glycosylhydrolase [Chloroflexia bacterium]|nr:cellulase family glycosylhydrolase [Chloroflexia bacterium]
MPPLRPQRLRRSALFFLLALACLAGLLVDWMVLRPCSPASFSRPGCARALPNTALNPFGVNIFLDREPLDWRRQRTMEMIEQAGFGWVKQQFSWAEIEPQPDYFWDDKYKKSSWEKFDRIVDLAEEYGLEIVARLDRPPAWARPEGSNPQAPPYDPHEYADFVHDFVQHYQGRIHYIQIWNEPNLHTEWREGAPVDPRAYVKLLALAYQRAKEADPNVQVLCAPLSVHSGDDPQRLVLSELTYLEEIYQAGGAVYFDIMSANAYGFEAPPEAEPDPSRYNFRRVELLRLIMEKYGDADKAIWFNEYGWNAASADMAAEQLTWGRVSEQQQAEWTVEGILYAQEHWPWAGVIAVWYFQPIDISPQKAEYYFRLVNEDFTPLPVYAAVQKAAADWATAVPGLYEELCAPVGRQGDWQLIYDDAASCGSYVASNEAGSQLVLTFQGSELKLRLRRGPDGGRFLVSLDGVSGRGTDLPQDEFGRAYLDLYGPDVEWVEIELIQGLGRELPPQAHRIELTVADEKAAASSGHLCTLDAFEVGYHRSYLLFGLSAGLLLVGLLGSLVALGQSLRQPSIPEAPTTPVNPWTLRADEGLEASDSAEDA